MKFEIVNRVPIVEIGGKRCFFDTCYPGAITLVAPHIQNFFGIERLHVVGVRALKRYTKFDYKNNEIITTDDPIPLVGGVEVPLEVRNSLWLVEMTVGGVEGMYYIDTGAAYSYAHNLSTQFPSAGIVDECGWTSGTFNPQMRHVPCEFEGHPFDILCGDRTDNPECVPPEGVIGYDFFNNFIIVVDRVGKKMIFNKK
jgi:hypothetical protein